MALLLLLVNLINKLFIHRFFKYNSIKEKFLLMKHINLELN